MPFVEWLFSILMGIALAAACGLRVLLHLFLVSFMSYSRIGPDRLQNELNWLGELPALRLLGSATQIELLAYYWPGLDNLLDAIAIPLAAASGTLAMVAHVNFVEPP
ncbi:MAG: DUF4126 domain-containing protein [Flavobacteriales bacterium]|nr:DUF4126 domain-containing protein [Flavobacteriales bacterium]